MTICVALWTLFSWLVCGDQRGDNGGGRTPNRNTYSREISGLLAEGCKDLEPPASNAEIFSSLLRGLDSDQLSRKKPLKRIRRKRGKRGGVQRRIRKVDVDVRRSLPPLPTILLSNVQSIRNKLDELEAYARCKREFKETCLLALTETWLGEADRDDELFISGFGYPIRMDRSPSITNKAEGEGVCFYVNERYCGKGSARPTSNYCPSPSAPFAKRVFPTLFHNCLYSPTGQCYCSHAADYGCDT